MLINNLTELKKYLLIGAGNDFNRLKPHISSAENQYIIPLIGLPLYEELDEFIELLPIAQPSEVQEATIRLLEMLQGAIVHLAYHIGFDFLNVSVTDAGFLRIESDTKKSLFKYQENALKKYFRDTGINALDSVLLFLEQNIRYFNEFKLTTNWTNLKGSFLPTVSSIENIPFNIHNSRLILLSLKPHFLYVEETIIKPLVTNAIYEEIKAGMALDNIPEKVKNILPHIQRPLIYLASAMLMEETGGTLDERGLFFEKVQATYPDNTFRSHSEKDVVDKLVARNNKIGIHWLSLLKTYLINNPELWSFSQITGSPYDRDNTNKRTFFA